MVKITLPSYYDMDLYFYEVDNTYYMQVVEWTNQRTEISKEFYNAAVKEFATEKIWVERETD